MNVNERGKLGAQDASCYKATATAATHNTASLPTTTLRSAGHSRHMSKAIGEANMEVTAWNQGNESY